MVDFNKETKSLSGIDASMHVENGSPATPNGLNDLEHCSPASVNWKQELVEDLIKSSSSLLPHIMEAALLKIDSLPEQHREVGKTCSSNAAKAIFNTLAKEYDSLSAADKELAEKNAVKIIDLLPRFTGRASARALAGTLLRRLQIDEFKKQLKSRLETFAD